MKGKNKNKRRNKGCDSMIYAIQWDSNALNGKGQIQWIKVKSYKFLIKQNNQYYTFNNSEIVLSPSQKLNQENFKINGFGNPSNITEEQWNNVFPDKTGLKLLMWTEDLEKKEVKAECEIEPFTPYDKLNNEFEICMLTDKETV